MRAVVDVQDYISAVGQVAQTSLRSIIGKSDLDDLLSNRERLNEGLELLIDSPALGWGVQIDRVEIKDVALPESMKRSMSRQAEAERERRARVISADGELQASEKLALAAAAMAEQPGGAAAAAAGDGGPGGVGEELDAGAAVPGGAAAFPGAVDPATPTGAGHHGCCGGTGGVDRSPADRRRLERRPRRRRPRAIPPSNGSDGSADLSRSGRGGPAAGRSPGRGRGTRGRPASGRPTPPRASSPRRNRSPFSRLRPPFSANHSHGVGVEHLAPDVGVVAGAVAAAEDVVEVGAAVARRRAGHRDPGRGERGGLEPARRRAPRRPGASRCQAWSSSAAARYSVVAKPSPNLPGLGQPVPPARRAAARRSRGGGRSAARICGSSSHISLTCDGYSTKSRGTPVPANVGYRTSENSPCSACPNSWNRVRTLSRVSRVGSPSAGRAMLSVFSTTGRVPSRCDWLTNEFIQAPPRLESRA